MNSFNLSKNIDENKIFIRNRSELEGRWDPFFFYINNSLKLTNYTKFSVVELKNVIQMQRGRFGHRPRNEPSLYNGNYPFIQTGDVVKSNFGNKISYTQTLNEKGLATSRLFSEPVVVLTIAANIGYTAILDYPACFPDSLIALKPKNDLLRLEYINVYFSLIQKFIESLAPQAAQKNINYQQLSSIPIVVPPIPVQNDIINIYFTELNHLNQKEKEAQALLDSIDDYLMQELGIELPENDNSLNSRIFERNLSDIQSNRWDVFYHKPWFKNFYKNSLYPILKLSFILKFIESGSRPKGGVSNITKGVLSLGGEHVHESGSVDISSPKYISVDFHNNNLKTATELYDILLVKDGATTGKIGIIENTQLINQNINEHLFILRVNEKVITPYFTFFLLHTKIMQIQMVKNKTGATVTGLTKRVTKNLQLPVPPLSKQDEIVSHIQSIRNRAEQLKIQAEQQFENAKKEIEKMILGDI